MKTSLRYIYFLFIGLLLPLLLSSCANMSSESVSLRSPFNQNPNYYLGQANQAQGAERQTYRLQAVAAYFYYGDFEQGRKVLYGMKRQYLSPLNQAQYDLLSARLALQDEQPERTIEIVNALADNPNLDAQMQIESLKLRAAALLALKQPIDSIKTRILITPLLTEQTDIDQNQREIWQIVNGLPTSDLQNLSQDDSQPVLQGWASLALTVRDHQNQPTALVQALKTWQQQFPDNPAVSLVSTDMGNISNWMQTPTQVALLLPMSGNLASQGQAILNGFTAAYYQARQQGAANMTIKVYDTAKSQDIVNLYQQAVQDGAKFVVGPLLKNNVAKLANDGDINVPSLALNFSTDNDLPKNYYEFALSPIAEARAIADKATQLGFVNAVTISPQGEWGDQIRNAFTKRWVNNGGKLVSNLSFNSGESFKFKISDLLNINDSYLRRNALQKAIGEKVKFSPRRRRDIDVIFLNAMPQDARQILPLLRFYYAGNIPVFATSQLYNGKSNPDKNSDLDGVNFTIMPWLVAPSASARVMQAELTKLWPASYKANSPLYAFGSDAYLLTTRMGQLQAFPSFGVRANTGTLFIGKNQRIVRQTDWAEFKKGQPKLIKFDSNVIIPLTDGQ